jgi:serine/threonine-protein kinase
MGVPSWAVAQNPGDLTTAEALFDAGRKLMRDQSYQEACPKFEQSLKLDDGIGTRLWLADCYEKSGRIASAWAQFRQASWMASRQSDSRVEVGKAKAAALEARLPRLVIEVPAERRITGLVVERDGSTVVPEVFGVAIPVDPGPHRIEARATGKRVFTIVVEMPEGKQQWVTIPSWIDAISSPSSQRDVASGASGEHPKESTGETSSSWLPIGFAGLALIGISSGAYMGLKAKSRLDDSRAYCNGNVCNETGGSLRDDAKSAANVSTVLFGVGAVSALTATILFATGSGGHNGAASLSVGPTISTLGGGMSMGGEF